MVLNQPKWKKFLSLKGQENNAETGIAAENGEKPVKPVSTDKLSNVDTLKKRKRTEEEIAQRKAKKLKSKGKESQAWEQLSKEHQKSLSAEKKTDEEEPAATESDLEKSKQVTEPDQSTSTSKAKPDAALLSTKAKEIAKARREEKLQEKQQTPKKQRTEASLSDKKADQVVEYLEEYRAHVASGAEWKFKKQHQNWIIKHLYSYLWKSDDIVVAYLKTVKGHARDRLVADAKEVVRLAVEDEKAHGPDVVQRAQSVITALSE